MHATSSSVELRHPLPVAVLAPAFAVLVFSAYHPGAGAAIAAFVTAVVVVVSAYDVESRIIPNRIVLPAAAAVLVARIAFFSSHWQQYVIAAVVAGAAFAIPNLINKSLMGMGDAKLALLLGAGLGTHVLAAMAVAWTSVFPVALFMLIRGGRAARKATLPFGPFLALGAVTVLAFPHIFGLS